eukprot:3261172-Amphidinium_carterae.3
MGYLIQTVMVWHCSTTLGESKRNALHHNATIDMDSGFSSPNALTVFAHNVTEVDPQSTASVCHHQVCHMRLVHEVGYLFACGYDLRIHTATQRGRLGQDSATRRRLQTTSQERLTIRLHRVPQTQTPNKSSDNQWPRAVTLNQHHLEKGLLAWKACGRCSGPHHLAADADPVQPAKGAGGPPTNKRAQRVLVLKSTMLPLGPMVTVEWYGLKPQVNATSVWPMTHNAEGTGCKRAMGNLELESQAYGPHTDF